MASAVDLPIGTPKARQRITEIIQQTFEAFKGGETDSPSPDSESDKGRETDEPSPSTADLDSYKAIEPNQTWIGKQIKAFTFNGKPYKVKYWNEFLPKFCEILSEDYPDRFEDVLKLKPHSFSKNPDAKFPKSAKP